jgi:hypothetical protein
MNFNLILLIIYFLGYIIFWIYHTDSVLSERKQGRRYYISDFWAVTLGSFLWPLLIIILIVHTHIWADLKRMNEHRIYHLDEGEI